MTCSGHLTIMKLRWPDGGKLTETRGQGKPETVLSFIVEVKVSCGTLVV
jgi:hypothetical protein